MEDLLGERNGGAAHGVPVSRSRVGVLVWLGLRGRGRPVVLAMLVATGVSLVVNDTPVDVLGYGALGLAALTAWDETRGAAADRAPGSSSGLMRSLRSPREHSAP